MERSSFFNSVFSDRRYKAEQWAEYFASFIGNGVFPEPSTGLQVIAGVGMNVVIRPGKAWINGYFYINDAEMSLPLPTADGVLRRIDRVVIRWDLTYRAITAKIKSSAAASNPTPPPLQRDADAYEIAIADIIVAAGATTISQSNITDRRFNADLCGVVAGVVKQIDPDFITAQFDAFFAEYTPKIEADYAKYAADIIAYYNLYRQNAVSEYNSFTAFLASYESDGDAAFAAFLQWLEAFKTAGAADFQTWFDSIKDILDEDTAGHILQLIEALEESQPSAAIGTVAHELGCYPDCTLYKTDYAAGIGGAGEGGAGGGNLVTVPAEFTLDGFERAAVKTTAEFAAHTESHRISEGVYSFVAPGGTSSLILIMR